MANKLFEAYKNRLAVADRVHMQSHNGSRITESKKIAVARLLDNTSKVLSEAL